MQNVKVYIRRPIYNNEILLPSHELAETNGQADQEPYRLVSNSHPLVLNQYDNSLELYGMLTFDPPITNGRKKHSIKACLLGECEVKLHKYGVLKFEEKKDVLRILNVVLNETDAFPEPNSSGRIELPFALLHRAPDPLPITFASPSSRVSYRLIFKYITKDTSFTLQEISVPVTVIPPWAPGPPAVTSTDDGNRLVLDTSGEIQGSASIREESDTMWLRPRLLNNIVDRPVSPTYSEVDEGSFSGVDSSDAQSFDSMKRRLKRSFQDVSGLRSPLSKESVVMPVQENEPLPYTQEDPLVHNLLSPLSISSEDAPHALADATREEYRIYPLSSGQLNRASFLSVNSPPPPPDLSQSRSRSTQSRFSVSYFSNHVTTNRSFTSPRPPSFIMPRSSFHMPRSPEPEDQIDIPRHSPSTLESNQSILASLLSKYGLESPLFRIVVPITMAGPSSILPVQVHIQAIPPNHTLKSLTIYLKAVVKCKALGTTKEDLITLKKSIIEFENGETVPIQKHISLDIPEDMGTMACGFTIPLIELSHQLVFKLKTVPRVKGVFKKERTFDLGNVSIQLLR